ncbi:MAG: PEGA domain-containing protein, partial [Paludibacter sp.]|nr:PEGA domain-containing protein [Paludibacter sp.]
MKKLLTTLFLLAVIVNLSAEISVKSFRKLENDLDARVNAPLKDFSGDLSAIIKVVTTQTGFTFDCGSIGIVKTVNKSAEIWVYVPYGAKRITIMHPQLGQLRDWLFTQPIEKATVYEMVLT